MKKSPIPEEIPTTGMKSGQVVDFMKSAPKVPTRENESRAGGIWRYLIKSPLKWLGALIVVAALAWYFASDFILGPVVNVDKVALSDVIQTVVSSGQVLSPYHVNIGTQVVGVVRAIPVAQGQLVKKGDLLIQLDDDDAREAVRLAQSQTAQWKAKLDEMSVTTLPLAQEAQQQAQATLVSAQINFDRADALQRTGAGANQAVDDARKALELAKSELRSAQLRVAAASPDGSDYIAAQAQYDQALASQHSAEAKLGYYHILATRDGTLTTRNVEAGDTVQPGTILMALAPAGNTQIDMQIDEINLGSLKIGQKAHVSADAYPKQSFDSVLSFINPGIDPQSGSVEVKLDIADPPDYLLESMTVSAEIEVARKDHIIMVPIEDVHDLTAAHPWVFMVEQGKVRRHPIAIGTVGDTSVEVADGLKPGDVVLRGQAAGKSDGERVRFIAP